MTNVSATVHQESAAGPESSLRGGDKRLAALDLIRGVAILGILPVHISIFGGSGFTPQQGSGADLLGMFTMMLVEGKMVTMLAILFGVGLAIQSDRASAKGRGFTRYYVRRMLFLFLIGLAHALLLFQWDILTSYAVAGLAALCLHRLSDRTIARIGVCCFGWCYALILICMLVAVTFHDEAGASSETDQTTTTTDIERNNESNVDEPIAEPEAGIASFFSEEEDHDIQVFREGSFADMVVHRAIYLVGVVAVFLVVGGWYTLACFLTGILLFRRGVFQDVQANRSFWRSCVFSGLSIGGVFHVVGIVLYTRDPEGMLPICVLAVGVLPLALGYLALLTLWSQSQRVTWLQKTLESVGRLALTNYLFQSFACGFVFYSYGFALYGRLSPTTLLLIVICVWLSQLLLSRTYLRFFRIGPVEWLWRSLSDGRFYSPTGSG